MMCFTLEPVDVIGVTSEGSDISGIDLFSLISLKEDMSLLLFGSD